MKKNLDEEVADWLVLVNTRLYLAIEDEDFEEAVSIRDIITNFICTHADILVQFSGTTMTYEDVYNLLKEQSDYILAQITQQNLTDYLQ
jgi:hypothetical protein